MSNIQKKMNKTTIILILSILLLIMSYLYFKKQPETVKIVTSYDTITKIIDNTKPSVVRKIYIKVPKIVEKTTNSVSTIDTIYVNKEVQKYTYKDTLQNGVLESTILADNIYKRDIKLTTFNKNTTITKVQSSLYFGSIVNVYDRSILNISSNAFYTHKNKWLITGGVGFNTINNKINYSIGVGFKF